jgi:hypothetical protein
MKHFDVDWKNNDAHGPVITEAKCRECGQTGNETNSIGRMTRVRCSNQRMLSMLMAKMLTHEAIPVFEFRKV